MKRGREMEELPAAVAMEAEEQTPLPPPQVGQGCRLGAPLLLEQETPFPWCCLACRITSHPAHSKFQMFRTDQHVEQLRNHEKEVRGWITMVSPRYRRPHPTPAAKYTSKPVHESMGASLPTSSSIVPLDATKTTWLVSIDREEQKRNDTLMLQCLRV